MIVKAILTFLQHVFLANSYMSRYSNHMISTEIEQKKVEEQTLERMGGFMGWSGGGGEGAGSQAPPAPLLGKINFVLFLSNSQFNI